MATTLRAGGIAIIGYNGGSTDGTGNPATEDKISFVITEAITSGAVIYFTDRKWTPTAGSTTLGAGTFSNDAGQTDGTFTWTASRDYAAGEVVSLTQTQLHAAGFNFEHTGGEAIYAYQGAINAPTHFLWALEAGDGNATFTSSLVNTGLTAGYTAGSIGGDSGAYVGPSTHAQTFLANGAGVTILHAIADQNNWAMDDQDGQNALEQPVQTQNWFVHHDVDLWSTSGGGGGGIINLGSDATQGAGAIGQQISNLYNNLLNNDVSVFWSLNDMVIDTVNGKFFLADSDIQGGHNRILQGNIADLLGNPGTIPALTVLYSDPGITTASTIDTLAIDPVNGIVYFTHGDNLEKIVYNTPSQTPTVLFSANTVDNPAGSGSNFFGDIAINFTTNEVYLSSYRVTTATSSDAVTKNYIYKLTGLTPNAGADHFTFPNGKAALLPFSPDDDDATAGSTVLPGGEGFPKEEGTISGLAINPLTNMLFFSTGSIRFDHDASSATPAQFVRGAIFSYNLNTAQNPNGLYTQIYEPTDDGDANSQTIQPQFGPQGLLNDIEIDIVNNKWYVVDYTGDQLGQFNPPGDEGIWRGNLNGTGQPEFFGDINNINGLAPKGFTINNAPTLTGSAAGGLAVSEASSAPNSGETSRVTLFTGIAIDDVNTGPGDEIAGAVIRIGEGFTYEAASTANGHTGTVDHLRMNGLTGTTLGNETTYTVPGSGIVAKYNITTGAMVLTGAATVAEYKAAIELVQFSTSGDNVTADGTAVTRKVYVSVSDGLTMSDEIVATVNVTGINDAPVNAAGSSMSFTEDTTGIVGSLASPFTTAPVNAITGISIADADGDASSDLFTVTLTVNVGTLTIRTEVPGGLVIGQISGNNTSSITVTGTQNQINTTLAATYGGTPAGQANGLVFTAPANFNGAATLAIVTNDSGNSGNDPDTVGDNGTTEADTDTKTLNVVDVNDAPTVGGDGTEDSPTILEDVPYTNLNAPTVATLFGGQFSDALDVQFVAGTNPTGSTGNALRGIAIIANGSSVATGQWQYWNGSSWVNIGAASVAAAKTITATTMIRFEPALNYNGNAPTLTAHLIETNGPTVLNGATVNLTAADTKGGMTVYSVGTVTLSQAITSVNDAPVNTVGSGITINEDAAAIAVTGISIADVDAGLNIMTVTLNAEYGTLTIRTDVAGGITSGHVASATGKTITINATLEQINTTLAAANGLTYLADAHYNGADRVRVTTSDNGGSGQDPVPGTGTENDEQDVDDKAVTINAVNDAPSGADKTITMLEDGRYPFTTADFGFTDAIDNHGLQEVVITTLPATGGLFLLFLMPMPPMGVMTIKNAVVAGQAIPVSEITGGRFVYEPALNANGLAYSTFTFQVRDNGGVADGGQNTDGTPNTITSDVTAVNDAPTIANLQGNTVAWTEGDGPVRLDNGLDALVGDIDSLNFDGGTLTVGYANGLPEDQYTINVAGTVSVTIDPNDSTLGTVSVGGVQIATYTFSSSGYAFTFNADATPARVQELVRAIGYSNNAGDTPTAGTRNVTWMLNDGDGGANFGSPTLVVNTTVSVNAVNDAPVLVTGGPIPATEQTAVAMLPAGSVADADLDARNGGLGDYGGSTFSVNRNPATNAAEDRFSLVAGPNFTVDGASLKTIGGQIFGTISVDGSAGAIAINFTSLETIATSALVDEVIQAVRYTNTSDKPPASVDLDVGFSDGAPGGGQGSGATGLDVNLVTVNIAGVNDAPVNALGGTITTGEDSADLWLSGMSISDPDGDPATDGMYVTFQVANGSIAIRTDVAGGIVVGDIIGEATDTITVLATLNKINATLAASNGLTYTPKPDFNGNDTLTVYANDAGASGSDPGLSGDLTNEEGVATRTIAVTAAPDDPTAVADSGSVLENATLVLDVIANDTNPDGDAQVVTVEGETVTVGQALALASGATLTLQANGTLIYNPAGAFDALISPGKAASTGAGKTSATDGFSYTINGGSAAIAVVTVNGVDGPGDRLEAPAADASLTGTGDTDLFVLDRPYSHEVSGGAGSDGFYLGANLSAGDKLDGGDGPLDTLGLQGGYGAPGTPFLFTADHLVGMEILALLPAADTRFGASGEGLFGYNLRTIDANVADGARLVVTFNTLNAGENVRFDGSAETNGSFFTYGGRGNDVLIGGEGDDGFYFGAGRFGAGDDVSGGDGDMDTLGLQGGYAGATQVTFGAGQMDGIEILALLTAADARFNGNGQAAYSYDVTMNDGNVASLGQLVVSANSLLPNETLTFNGAAETDGRFVIFSGDGADTLIGGGGADEINGRGGSDRITGGMGADQLRGGDGADTFVYLTTDDSRTGAVDQILDFGSVDTIDLSAIDANALTADINDAFTFIGSAAFSGGGAAGQLRAVNQNGTWTVEGDTNGDGDADLIILVTTPDPLVMLNDGSFVP